MESALCGYFDSARNFITMSKSTLLSDTNIKQTEGCSCEQPSVSIKTLQALKPF